MIELEVHRYSDNGESTLGLLFLKGDKGLGFLAYTLEDENRTVKVWKETRIPEGKYRIKLRKEGGMYGRYKSRYAFFDGNLWLQDVPNFKYVYIHVGNDDDDTAGCLLVANNANNNQIAEGMISNSAKAYRRLYQPLAEAIENDEEVWIAPASPILA